MGITKEAAAIVNEPFLTRKLHVENPKVPVLYALPKNHKPGKKMRPIASNNNAPTEKMAHWLLDKFKKLNPPKSFQVKNSLHLVQMLSNTKIRRNEIMVSFDVEALYPSIPRKDALEFLEIWLQQENVPPMLQNMYIKMAKICIEQSTVQFRGKFYKLKDGVSMGNPISSFLANLFMAFFETRMSGNKNFPRIWLRYVDDVFAIINPRKIPGFLQTLNNKYTTINFTIEKEIEGRLPFLEIMIMRSTEGDISFEVYRKPTYIPRYITNDSFHSTQHKKAAFNTMIHRMIHIPMSKNSQEKEKNTIYEIANINGYGKEWVDGIIHKIERKKRRADLTTHKADEKTKTQKKLSVTHFPQITNSLEKLLAHYGLEMITKSNRKLRSVLSTYKDKQNPSNKSGIYEITCDDCNAKYIGQSKRKIIKRFKEHIAAKNNNHPDMSAVAKHLLDENHNATEENLRLIKEVNDERKLNIYESIAIKKRKPAMNEDLGPHNSILFNILTDYTATQNN